MPLTGRRRKRLHIPLLLFVWCVCVVPARADNNLKLLQIGLGGVAAQNAGDTRILLEVRNPGTEVETFELGFEVYDLATKSSIEPFRRILRLQAREVVRHELVAPLCGYQGESVRGPNLSIRMRDSQGRVVGYATAAVNTRSGDRHLVAQLCRDDATCEQIQTEILFSGGLLEQADKNRKLQFTRVLYPPEHWAAYEIADVVVLAQRLSDLSDRQREALEEYLRGGGRVILIESLVRTPEFLKAKRRGSANGSEQPVGRGTLVRLQDLARKQLGNRFPTLTNLVNRKKPEWPTGPFLRYLEERVETTYEFPGTASLLIWLVAYVLVTGPIAFLVLSRLRRREWAWVVLPGLAVVFSLGLYATSRIHRPKQFLVDETGIHWMDDDSTLATTIVTQKIISPVPSVVIRRVPDPAIVKGRGSYWAIHDFVAPPFIFDEITETPPIPSWTDGWVRLGNRMLSWSYKEHSYETRTRFPGTVRLSAPGVVRNDTGQLFRQALFVDRTTVYQLGELPPGTEVRLASVPHDPIANHFRKIGTYPLQQFPNETIDEPTLSREREEWWALLQSPFSLIELVRGWPADYADKLGDRKGLFFGLTDKAPLGVTIDQTPVQSNTHSLTIVSIWGQP